MTRVTQKLSFALVSPLSPPHQDLLEEVGAIGDDAVDLDVEQSVHLDRVVDRPHMNLEPRGMGAGDQPAIDDADPARPHRKL